MAADSARHRLLSPDALERRAIRIDDADGLHGPPAPAPGWVAETPAGRVRQREHYSRLRDAGLLGGLLKQARDGLGRGLKEVVADAGYAGGADLEAAEAEGAAVYAPWQSNDYTKPKEVKLYPKEGFTYVAGEDAYECPAGQRLGRAGTRSERRSGEGRVELTLYRAEAATCAACPKGGECTKAKGGRSVSRSEYEEVIGRVRERTQTPEAKDLYRLRKQTVERLNADLKRHRGLSRISGRGLARAGVQVGLLALGHNLITLHNLRQKTSEATPPAPPP